MRKFQLLLLFTVASLVGIAIVIWFRHRPDQSVTGSYSHDLSLDLQFAPATEQVVAEFIITLKNETRRDLKVKINDKLYCGLIHITPQTGRSYDIYDVRFLKMLQTGLTDDPIVLMNRDKHLMWRVPLASLADIYGKGISANRIAGCRGEARIEAIAVIDHEGTFASNNALQVSPTIQIIPN